MTEVAAFADRLLSWWDEHGRHDLPWQHPRTPYQVWVSEIMLQQTQVGTVIPYFERFMARFPTLESLAKSPLDDVLALWAGLGYYARARNLHKAAGLCASERGGDLPATAEGLAALPGIGASTANAIVSQAQDIPAAVVDGNVRRVLARYRAVDGWPGETQVNRELWSIAEGLLPSNRGADYTQAIMDLGATLCTRSRARCEECPVRSDCQAFAMDAVDRFPAPKPKIRIREQALYMLIARDGDGAVLLEQRPAKGIWGGLWSLPASDSAERVAVDHGLDPAHLENLPGIQHRLTHRLLNITPCRVRPDTISAQVKCREGQRWVRPAQWRQLGLPKPVAGILETQCIGENT